MGLFWKKSHTWLTPPPPPQLFQINHIEYMHCNPWTVIKLWGYFGQVSLHDDKCKHKCISARKHSYKANIHQGSQVIEVIIKFWGFTSSSTARVILGQVHSICHFWESNQNRGGSLWLGAKLVILLGGGRLYSVLLHKINVTFAWTNNLSFVYYMLSMRLSNFCTLHFLESKICWELSKLY